MNYIGVDLGGTKIEVILIKKGSLDVIDRKTFKGGLLSQLQSAKEFVLPKKIFVDRNFIAGIAMYLGDGSLNSADLNHLSFCSIDKLLSCFPITTPIEPILPIIVETFSSKIFAS